ncbi:phage tail tip lysozyme [Enterococcus faecalis]
MGQRETAKQIWDYLTSNGWTQQSVAGLLGNMQSESGIIADRWESDIVGNMNGGYGLVQWTPASKYINWAQSNGLVYQNVISQCNRLEWEVTNNEQFYNPDMSFFQFTQSTLTPEELADIFIKCYERPRNPNQPIRQVQARYWYNQFNNQDPSRVDTAIEAMIKWMKDHEGKVCYSMDNRYGPDTYDCSSSVYNSLKAGGFISANHIIGNTDTLFGDLESTEWTELPVVSGQINAQRGDIFIWGVRGHSTGQNFGHTGIFVDANNIIHCHGPVGCGPDRGISTNDHDWWRTNSGGDNYPNTIYHYIGNGHGIPSPNPDPGTDTGLIAYSGVFYPTIQLPVSGDTDPNSPALAYYNPGMPILYDSYTFANGYAWISYISYGGTRSYVAVGPDDGRTDTVWGTGFLNNIPEGNGNLIPYSGVFIPTIQLPVSRDTDSNSPAIAYYSPGMPIIYDSYIFTNGYAWISYISYGGTRSYVAVGPDDGRTDTVWGTGFLNDYPGRDTGQGDEGHPILIAKTGTFYPDRTLPISADTDPTSVAVGAFDSGDAVYYDSYIFINGYAWISYVSSTGIRRYVAVGPDDGKINTVWGTGFFN